MSVYEKMDLKALKATLAENRYANATAARRAIGRSKLSDTDRAAAQSIINKHFGEEGTTKVAKVAKKVTKKAPQKKAQPKAAPKATKAAPAAADDSGKRKKKTAVSGKKGAGRATAKAAPAETAPAAEPKVSPAPKAGKARAARAEETPAVSELNPLARVNLLTELVGTAAEAIKALDLGRQLTPGLNTSGAEDAAAVINKSMGELRIISEGLVGATHAAPPPPPPAVYGQPPAPPVAPQAPVPPPVLSPEDQQQVSNLHAMQQQNPYPVG